MTTCGGGGDNVITGIGESGISTSDTIEGFHSIFVNGVEYETDTASSVLDSKSASDDTVLRLGMVATVIGTVDDYCTTDTAIRVEFDDKEQGSITAITPDADGRLKTLTVPGFSALADHTLTVFDEVTFKTPALRRRQNNAD